MLKLSFFILGILALGMTNCTNGGDETRATGDDPGLVGPSLPAPATASKAPPTQNPPPTSTSPSPNPSTDTGSVTNNNPPGGTIPSTNPSGVSTPVTNPSAGPPATGNQPAPSPVKLEIFRTCSITRSRTQDLFFEDLEEPLLEIRIIRFDDQNRANVVERVALAFLRGMDLISGRGTGNATVPIQTLSARYTEAQKSSLRVWAAVCEGKGHTDCGLDAATVSTPAEASDDTLGEFLTSKTLSSNVFANRNSTFQDNADMCDEDGDEPITGDIQGDASTGSVSDDGDDDNHDGNRDHGRGNRRRGRGRGHHNRGNNHNNNGHQNNGNHGNGNNASGHQGNNGHQGNGHGNNDHADCGHD